MLTSISVRIRLQSLTCKINRTRQVDSAVKKISMLPPMCENITLIKTNRPCWRQCSSCSARSEIAKRPRRRRQRGFRPRSRRRPSGLRRGRDGPQTRRCGARVQKPRRDQELAAQHKLSSYLFSILAHGACSSRGILQIYWRPAFVGKGDNGWKRKGLQLTVAS